MKRIVAIIIAFAVALPLAAAVYAAPVMRGDVDGDGLVTVADALAALRISVKLVSPDSAVILAADVDRDGSVTADDALAILRCAAGLDNPAGLPVLADASVGDTVTFGKYEQDNDVSNGKEDIEWKVIAKSEGKILLISVYALDAVPFNGSLAEMTWKKSSLRAWLNDGFAADAFSDEETERILDTKTKSDYNPKYNSNTVTTTTDRVFLLNYTEAGKYFESDADRLCMPTEYALSKGVMTDSADCCAWWLRTLGYDSTYATAVNTKGQPASFGYSVEDGSIAVRPAMWITTD